MLKGATSFILATTAVAGTAYYLLGGRPSRKKSKKVILPRELASIYQIDKRIGCGVSAKVYKAHNRKYGDPVAIKMINKETFGKYNLKAIETLCNEVTLLRKISHPGVVQLLDFAETETHLFIVMEFMDGGELYERLCHRPYTNGEAKVIIKKLAATLKYIHAAGVMHRDIKPSNILLKSHESHTDVKLCDLGVSTRLSFKKDGSLRRAETCCGSSGYAAPEVEHGDCEYDFSADMWSLGAVLHVLTTRKLATANSEDGLALHRFASLNPSCADLIRNLLQKDPQKRLTAEQVLCHPWLIRDD
eukprot:TRINITY_DN3567_c1_g1_i2.p1 TRINITY_DN3567_c1_g1~~TRINITY_DN3567_c1_g1_i2.p1  ORF type:complete len:303 (-),score=51.76 TRINITY_DN3567_c1_g1_i2:266-1174(-)